MDKKLLRKELLAVRQEIAATRPEAAKELAIKNTRGLSAEIFSGTSPEMLCHFIKAFTHAE